MNGEEVRGRRRIFWWVGLGLLSVGLVVGAFSLDRPVRESIEGRQGSIKKWVKTSEGEVWSGVSKYGDWPELMGVGVILLVASARWRRRDLARVVVAAMLASTVAGTLANLSRLTTGRVRPREEAKVGQGFHGPWANGKITVGNPGMNSFPSGHTATAVGFAVPFLFAVPLAGVPILLGAFAIGYSRMLLGAHHFSDIVTASVLAFWVGWWSLWWVRVRGDGVWDQLCKFWKRWVVSRA